MKFTLVRWGTVALMIGILAGCGGGGDTVVPAAGGGAAPAGGGAAPGAPVPTGAAPITLTAATPAATFAALTPAVTVGGVDIDSPPLVSFAVTDGNGNAIIGLGSTTRSATATVASYPNLAFSLAKLVPGTNGAPSKWVSYIVTTVPTTTAAATASRPTTDSTGTLVDNRNGTYTYTFYRDITTAQAQVNAMTLTAPNVAADLGDLTYEPNRVHRLTIAIYGNAPGTGTNTPDAVQVTPGVPMANPVNIIYDFIPARGYTGTVTATDPSRDIVATAKCNECHGKLGDIPGATKLIDSQDLTTRVTAGAGFHGGSRYDARYCVVCHTDQRKFGRTNVTATNYAFPALTRTVSQSATTGLYSTSYSPSTYVANGTVLANLPALVHKIHMGKELVTQHYNYANVTFNEVTYPQPVTNCVKCHDGSATSTARTANGDNWKTVASLLACGACHDGINFATGGGITLADAQRVSQGLPRTDYAGHIGGAQANDSRCALCHDATTIPIYHVTVDPTGSSGRAGYPVNTAANVPTPGYPSGQGPAIPVAAQMNLPAGVYKIDFEIRQVTVSGAAGARRATVVYRIMKDGLPVTLNATGNLITGVDGSPAIYVAYATAQDGIAAPADWNATKSATVRLIRDGTVGTGSTTACPVACSQTGPDATGFYTASLSAVLPDDARMITAAIGVEYQGFVQLNHADYPRGIRLREPQFVMRVADGQTPRRTIVSNAKCKNCHAQLGIAPSFHGGARNNGEGCAICHDANRATGHVGPNYSFGGGWSVATNNMVHAIHASSTREKAFTYEATAANPKGFQEVTYPGILKNCETCHVPGSYDFSAAANNAALPNLLWTTDAKGNMLNDATTNPTGIAPIGLSPWVTTLGRGQVDYRSDHLVSSPITAACFGCHDSSAAVAHMRSNNGTLLAPFSTGASVATRPAVGTASTMTFTRIELCTFCHTSTSVYGLGIRQVHAR